MEYWRPIEFVLGPIFIHTHSASLSLTSRGLHIINHDYAKQAAWAVSRVGVFNRGAPRGLPTPPECGGFRGCRK